MEEFRPICGFEGLYEVSNIGRVKSCSRKVKNTRGIKELKERIISQKDDTNGYLIVNLWKDNKQTHVKVHRAVAQAFIPNPYNFRDVNHIDENKYNNRVDNLEWVTHQDNLNYGTHNVRMSNSKSKAVAQYNKLTNELIATYKNAYVASNETNINNVGICQCCCGKRKTAGGYIWKYV